MEGDYWAKTYGRYASAAKKEPNIEDAQKMQVRDLLAFLNDAIPRYGDEDSSTLRYMLQMAKAAAEDLLAERESRKPGEEVNQQRPGAPIQLARAASRE